MRHAPGRSFEEKQAQIKTNTIVYKIFFHILDIRNTADASLGLVEEKPY
jgi:hypothetical protein